MTYIKYENIFDVVSDNKEEANELQTRADLMIVIRDIVIEKGWKQGKTAKILNLTRSRVNDLLNGKIDKFPIGLLMAYLFRMGFKFKPRYENNKLTITA